MGKVGETFDSGNNNHEVRVASVDGSDEKVYYGLPFAFGEYVSSHDLSIVEKGLNNLPFYNRNIQVCAQKDAKNLHHDRNKDCRGRFRKLPQDKQLGQSGFVTYDEHNGIHFYRKPKKFRSLQ